ncbi:MAG: elongation factor P maturation arginine rhamnosyltransferase EarP, partial [Sphingobacteriales bacterium]
TYIVAMKQQPSSPRWFNLDYLSAENWVEGFHGLDSIHPQYGLKKKFYFPGFTSKTGGLLREKSLFSERDIFQRDIEMRNAFLAKLGVKSLDSSLTISLFGYENNAISSLLDSFVEHEQSILCLVPAGRILPNINAYIGETLSAGDMFTKGALTLKVIPFLTQTDYDRLLWLCDINFVRGEDSFVRAQWAAKPFVWHIYPQEDGVHMEKLNAFLELYLKKADLGLSEEILRLWRNWNQEENVADAWKLCVKNYQTWLNHSQSWPNYLESLGDLAENIVRDSQKIM